MKRAVLFILLLSIVGVVWANEYPYWIEDLGDGHYNIWTKVNVSANSEKVIYITKTEGYKPDGDKVFEFFDDFEGTSLDTNKWQEYGSSVSLNNGLCSITDDAIGHYIDDIRNKTITAKITEYSSGGYGGFGIYETFSMHEDVAHEKGFCFRFDTTNTLSVLDWNIGSDPSSRDSKLLTKSIPALFTFKINDANIEWVYNDELLWTKQLPITKAYLKFVASHGNNMKIDYVFVRKYADIEPTTTISKINNNLYKMTIHNPNNYPLKDFQVKIDGTGIVESKTDSLLITDTLSNENIAIDILNASNETGFVELKIYNYTKTSYFIIDWDDGTTDNITALENETTVNHTYDLLHLIKSPIKIKITGYDDFGNMTSAKTVELNLIYPLEKFIENSVVYYEIRIANPYNENITNYDLDLKLTADNFDFWDTNLKPLGTNIYFRDENQYLTHYMSYFSQAEAKAEIHVNIPLIPANSYKTIYLAFADNDVPQYTFTGDNRTLLYIVIPHKQGTQLSNSVNNDSLIFKSADIASFKNITVLFVDENSLISGCTKSGVIQFVDDLGHKVVYTFKYPSLAIVRVSNLTQNGTIIVTTNDGIVRRVRYSDAPGFANVILIPNYGVAPLYVRGSGHVVVKTGGFVVTEEEAPCTIPLAIGQTYDVYIDGNLVKSFTMTEPTTITAIPTPTSNNIITYNEIKRIDNKTVQHTIITSVDAELIIKNGTEVVNEYELPANEKVTITAKVGEKYEIYVDDTLVKSGIYKNRDLGLLITLKDWMSEKWYMIFATILVLFTLWAGTWISAHVAVMLATFEILLFIYIDVFKFDPITKTILLILGVLMFAIMWMKR